MTLDLQPRAVLIDGVQHDLTPLEHMIIGALSARPDELVTKAALSAHASITRLDAAVTRLNHRLRPTIGANLIVMIWGVGYRLAPYVEVTA
jgi:DNA-binding response OmpR family regulator